MVNKNHHLLQLQKLEGDKKVPNQVVVEGVDHHRVPLAVEVDVERRKVAGKSVRQSVMILPK